MNADKSQGRRLLFEFDEFRLDPSERILARQGKRIPLPPRAFDTLVLLVQRNGHILTKDELIGTLWPDTFVEENNLTQQISALRRALGSPRHSADSGKARSKADGPPSVDPAPPEYIETVPRLGYRFVSEVREVDEDAAGSRRSGGAEVVGSEPARMRIVPNEERGKTELPHEPPPAAVPTTARWRTKPVLLGAAAAALAIPVLALYRFGSPSRLSASHAGTPTLAVLPLRNLRPGPETDFLSLALTDAIINRLGYASALNTVPLSTVAGYRSTDFDARRIARELNAQDVLTGSYVREGDDLRVTTELIRVGADAGLWRDNIELKYDKLLSVQDRVAISVIHSLGLELRPEEVERLNTGVPTNPAAYEYYLRGVDEGFRSNFKGAIEMLERSVALEPGDAMAWSELATSYLGYGDLQGGDSRSIEKGWRGFERALGLDPQNRMIVDLMAFHLLEHNRAQESVPLLRESLRRNPNDSFAHWYLSEAYRYGGALEQSVEEGELALRLNPNVARNLTFNTYLYMGLYRKFLDSLPPAEDNARTSFYRGLAYYYLRDSGRAMEEFDRAYALNSALSHARVGRALACVLRNQNDQGLSLMKDAERSVGNDGEMSYKMAQAYAQLGDRQSALRLLRRAIELNFCPYSYFVSDPMLEPVRREPGYSEAMELAHQRQQAFLSRTIAGGI
jgi:DNA-binding winged helix-turn-helix (wHTH) protein/TolB-like protein/Flp pilus assembly protein TadD